MSEYDFALREKEFEAADFIFWDFDATLFKLAVDWPLLRKEIKAMFPAIPGTYVFEMIDQAGADREAVINLTREHEIRGLGDLSRLNAWGLAQYQKHIQKSAIVTNNMRATIEAFFARSPYPAAPIIARDMAQKGKPDPEGLFNHRTLWQGKQDVLMVGDSEVDEKLAQAAGIRFVKINEF